MRLSHWRVEGYRSISEGEFEPSQFNILIGKNNSGKSNVLKSIIDCAGILTNDQETPFSRPNWEDLITRNDSHEEVCLSFEFELSNPERLGVIQKLDNYGVGDEYIDFCQENESFRRIRYQSRYVGDRRNVRWETNILPEGNLAPISDPSSNVSQNIRDLPPEDLNRSRNSSSAYGVLQQVLREGFSNLELIKAFREPENRMGASRVDSLDLTGGDLVQVIDTMVRNYPQQFEKVEETYTQIMEGVTGLRTPFVSRNNTTIMVDERGFSDGFSLDEISAGSKEILTLITKLVKAEENADILLIEEPELHIHPGAQQALYDLIQEVCSDHGPQVILSTHSDVFVNRTDSSNIISVKRNIETQIEPVEGDVEELLESLGYSKSEVLQSNAAVFVEGVSDQSVLQEFSKTLASANEEYESIEELGVTVRPLGGDRMRHHGGELHDSLSHLRIPHFFLADSDDQSPEEKQEELGEDLQGAELRVLNEYCIESYLLENPYAIADPFSLDEDEVRRYIEDDDERPNKKNVLNDLFQDLAGREGGYDEREHSWTIARNVRPEDIPGEIVVILDRIQDLAE